VREALAAKPSESGIPVAFWDVPALEDLVLTRFGVIRMPPYAPDHNPVEHVWNQGKGAIANLQRETPTLTFSASERFIKSGEFPYDFEHLPISRSESVFV
jgi:hypothetical protein